MQPDSARDLALYALDWCFAHNAPAVPIDGLAPFQARAVSRLMRIIERRGGAILADSVGLGKTHVALALIRTEVRNGGTAAVLAPAQLRAHWERHLRGVPDCRIVSHTALSRGARTPGAATLIVIDEAHAFRNPHTRRYAALSLWCEGARLLLLTATPVNNSLFDFYHLVRLFAAHNDFTDLGVPDLRGAVESAAHGGTGAELRRVSSAIMVRRTRESIGPSRAIAVRGSRTNSATARFPDRAPLEVVRYSLAAACPDLVAAVQRVLPSLTFPAHSMSARAPSQLMQLGLLKRLESSIFAFRASVRRHIRILEQFAEAAREGLLFDPVLAAVEGAEVDGSVQLSLRAIALRPWPAGIDRDRLLAEAAADLRALRDLCRPLSTDTLVDPKLTALEALLGGTTAKVLLFTAYRDTAHHIWRTFTGMQGVALIHGSDARLGRARSGRRTIVNRFAPLANGARAPRITEDVRVLIATDVLSEGMNLQDAAVAISYDIPWNPVRLSQRFGRIDRLGSPHSCIRTVVFAPDQSVDDLLGLMKRLRRKLRQVRIIGGDAPWSLAPSRRTARLIEEIERTDAARERALDVWSTARADTADAGRASIVCGEPSAIGRPARARTGRPPRADAPLTCAAHWPRPHHAALCCFAADGDILPVLVGADQETQTGSAEAWSVLASVASGTYPTAAVDISDLAPAAWVAARRALRGRRQGARGRGRSPAMSREQEAGTAILRWLASRPGGATADEVAQADTLLHVLRSGGRAGTELRLIEAAHQLATPSKDPPEPGAREPSIARAIQRRGSERLRPLALILLRGEASGRMEHGPGSTATSAGPEPTSQAATGPADVAAATVDR